MSTLKSCGPRVLLLDDDDSLRRALVRTLGGPGVAGPRGIGW